MTVDITQEEMNILNLNGISADEVRANVEFSRASGLDDNTIRQQFTDTINELKPFTKQTYNDTKKIQEWQKKGAITPYEYAQRKSVEFDGTYANVIPAKKQEEKPVEMNAFGKAVTSFADRVTKPIKDITPDFIKNGLKKVGNTLNDMGESSYQAQVNAPDDVVTVMSKLPNLDERTGKIGFQEGLARSYISGEWIPFVGGFIGGYDTKKENDIREKIRNGEAIRQDELDFLNHRLDIKNEENVRGYTLGGNIAKNFLPSLIRFGGEMGTGSWVLESLGWAGKAAEGANLLQKVGAGLKDMAFTGAVNTILPTGWNDIYENYQNRREQNTLEFTDKGAWIFKESQEKPATAFMKSLAETFVMFSSEASGQLLGIPVKGATGALSKYVASPIGKYLQANKQLVKLSEKVLPQFSKLYEKMNNLPIKGQNLDWLKSRVKFDGFLEECGEEVVEDVLNLTLGTTGEKRSLENYAKAIFKSPDEWAVIAGAIALQGGTLSVASHILGSHMEQNGATNEEIIETLNNLSENEKEQKVQELIEDGILNVSGVNETTQAVNDMTDDFYRKAVNAGITESQAMPVSSMFKVMLESFGTNSNVLKTVSNMYSNLDIFKNISVENAAKLLKGSVEYNETPDDVVITQRGRKLNKEYRAAVRNFEQVKSDFDNGKISFEDYQNAEAKLAAATETYNKGFAEIDNTRNKQYFQSATTAGAENSADYSAAQKEWKTKKTNSSFFKKWFGDSQVVNKKGKPQICYHTTNADFDTFDKNKIGSNLFNAYGNGFYFSSKPSTAKGYGKNVMKCYLSIQNPYVAKFGEEGRIDTEKLKEQGYDGVRYNDIWVAFEPEQIKSVDNQGTFDSENPNIYYQGVNDKSENQNKNVIDWTDKFDKVPAFEEIEKHIKDIIASGEVFDTLSPEWKIDIKGGNRVVKKITNQGNFQNLQNSARKRHNKYVSGIKELINNAVYSHSDKNTKSKEKPDILNYHYFDVNVKIGDKVYQVCLECEENKKAPQGNHAKRGSNPIGTKKNIKQTNINVKTVHLYNIKEIKKTPEIYFQSAYHGTPHRFDEFSTDNIGTGEGNQAHGWGLYFAENREISEEYRRNLTGSESFYYDGVKDSDVRNGKSTKYKPGSSVFKAAYDIIGKYYQFNLKTLEEAKEEAIFQAESSLKKGFPKNLEWMKESTQLHLDNLRKIDTAKIKLDKGQLYKVDIPETDEMLDEDKPFSEQSKKVQDNLKKVLRDEEISIYKKADESWEEFEKNVLEGGGVLNSGKLIYKHLSYFLYSDKNASLKLNEYGIKGITYNGRRDGRCYVVFDNKAVKVLETYYQENIPQEEFSDIHIEAARQYAAQKIAKDIQKQNVKPNTKLTEWQKRFRDTAYDILYTAASRLKDENGKPLVKSKRELYMLLGNDHKRNKKNHGLQARVEKLEAALSELGDEFSAYDGFEEQWAEFFTDTGISYDTQEVGGDAELAMQALDVIVNERYLDDKADTADRYARLTDDEIKRAYYEQDYFINMYKAIPENEDSSNVMCAWLDWVEFQPDFLQEELVNEWERRTQRVEGYNENDRKFAALTYADLLKIHKDKLLDKEIAYHGFFAKLGKKSLISICNSHDKSTILHELAHCYLDVLNAVAKYDDELQEKLNTVNKWLHASGNGEYTTKQQEKFARSFEAYLYTGKAPTNKLRQAFETFKSWLKEIYQNISLIPEADISKEAQEVFDLLFSNAEKDDKKSLDIYRKVKNIGVSKEKITNKNIDKKLDDTAARHRAACYDILHAKTGRSHKYLKYLLENKTGKTDIYDKIKELEARIDEDDNRISESGLMSTDWLEFFDNADLFTSGNDRLLARAAYETIVNKAYKQYFSEYDYVNEKSAQYDYLLKNFKNTPQEERTSVLGAFYMWCETLKGEDNELYLEKFMTDTAEIERLENMDEFERAKVRILEAAKKVQEQSLDKSEEYKQTVQAIFKELTCINNTDKAKLLTNILDIPSYGFLEGQINYVLDIAKTMEDVNTRRELVRKITKEIQGTKNVKKGSMTVGKYDYRTNKMFEQLRELDKLSSERAMEMLQNIRELAPMEEEGSSFEDKMFNRFLSYKANGINYSSTSNLSALYNDILKIKEAAANVKNEYELQQALNDGNDIQELVDILEKKKKANGLVKFYNEALCDLESSLNLLFNNKIKDKYSMLYRGAMTSVWIENEKDKFKKGVQKIYGRKDYDWDNDLLKYLTPKETETYYIHRREWDAEGNVVVDNTTPIELNRMHCILAYIWDKNEILHKRLVNMFGEQQLENMLGNLSVQDEQLGDFMQQMAGSYYNQINNVFIKKYGIDLPKVNFYFPSSVERISEVDMLNDYNQKSLGRGFIKNRTTSERVIMDFQNPVGILFSHIDGAGKFINYSEFIDKTNRVFRDKRVESLIKYKFGKDGLKVLQQSLANVTYKSEARQYNWFNKVLGNVASNWILSNIAIRPIVAIKQMLSCTNYAVDMPVGEWIAGFAKTAAHPVEATKYIMSIPAIKARFESGGQNEALKEHLNSSLLAQSQTFKDWQSLNVRLGDVGAIIFGGKPYIDYLVKTGVPEDVAIQKFVELTMRTQQSSDISSLSALQVEWGKNPIGKLFIAYRNAPIQYIRMAANSIVSYANGEMSKQQCAKVLFNFLVLQPFLYSVATSGSWLALALGTGGWDDILKDLWSSILTGNADAFSLFGDLYSFAVNLFIFGEKGSPDKVPLLSDLQQEMLKLSKKDVTMKDVAGSLLEMASKTTGFSGDDVVNMAGGVGDVAQGKFIKGGLRMLGMTKYRAGVITGDKDKR